jgi:hypothetical protein
MTTVEKLEAAEKALKSGELKPLDFILEVMRNERLPLAIRFKAAIIGLPYCHAKLARVKQPHTVGNSHEEWVKKLADMDEKHN